MTTLRIIQLQPNDAATFRELVLLFASVFDTNAAVIPGEAYLAAQLAQPGFVAFAAMLDGVVIGGLSAYELRDYRAEGSELFLYDIAVRPDMQRTGAGRQLMDALKAYCSENGIRELFVAADEEDQDALDFYKATGGEEAKVVHFSYDTA